MSNVEQRKTCKRSIQWLFILVVSIIFLSAVWCLPSDLQATASNVPIDNWSSTKSLPINLGAVNAITHNDTIYLIGGRQLDGSPTDQVYRSTINADGTLGSWGTTSPLPIELYLHSVSATDTHVYVIGGWKGSSPVQKRVYRAPFMANGNLGAWVNVNRDYPTKIDLHGSVIINGGIYSIGGFNGDVAVSTVYYSSIDTNGNLSTWTTRTALPQALYRHAVTAHNGYIYVTGGVDANRTAQSVVYYAKVNSDGTLGSWQNGPSLPKPLYYHRVVIHDGNLVVIAGKDDTSEFSAVYSTAINTNNGSLDNWTAEPSLPISLYRFAAVPVEKYGSEYIYVIGGFSSGKVQTNVYHSAIPSKVSPTVVSPIPEPPATPTPPASSVLAQEAENGILNGLFEIGEDNAASGGQYVHVPLSEPNLGTELDPTQKVHFTFNVTEPGAYRLKGQVYSPNVYSNSFYVQVNSAPSLGYLWHTQVNNGYSEQYVTDGNAVDLVEIYLQSGSHTVDIYLREVGTRLDTLVLERIEDSQPAPILDPIAGCSGMKSEAEDGELSGNFIIGPDEGASNGAYVHVPDGMGNSDTQLDEGQKARYCLTITDAGLYRINGWVNTPPQGKMNNSFYVRINDLPSNGYLWHTQVTANFEPQFVTDQNGVNVVELALESGIYIIDVFLREDGTRLDKLALERIDSTSRASNVLYLRQTAEKMDNLIFIPFVQ